jgi:hypothetical protein
MKVQMVRQYSSHAGCKHESSSSARRRCRDGKSTLIQRTFESQLWMSVVDEAGHISGRPPKMAILYDSDMNKWTAKVQITPAITLSGMGFSVVSALRDVLVKLENVAAV